MHLAKSLFRNDCNPGIDFWDTVWYVIMHALSLMIHVMQTLEYDN